MIGRTAGKKSKAPRTTPYRTVFAVAEFRALFAFHFLRVATEVVTVLALAVLVYDRTSSALASAAAFIAGMLPQVFGGALLMSLADRLRPRSLLVWISLLRCAITAVLALEATPIPVAVALLALMGLLAPLLSAASQGLLRDLLPEGGPYVLGRSLFTMTMAGAQLASQAAGGVLLLWLRPHGVLWTAAVLGLLTVAAGRFGLRDHPPRSALTGADDSAGPGEAGDRPGGQGSGGDAGSGQADGAASRNVVGATWQANRRLLADRRLRGLFLAQWVPFSLAVGAEGVIVPYAAGLSDSGAAGFLYATVAAGLFLGNLLLGRFCGPDRQESLALPMALLLGLSFVLLALRPGFAAALVIVGVGSLGFAYELGVQRRFAEAVPPALNGQAFGLLSTGLMAGQSVCMLAAGALAEVLPAGTVMAVCGAASAVTALLLHRHLRPEPSRPATPAG